MSFETTISPCALLEYESYTSNSGNVILDSSVSHRQNLENRLETLLRDFSNNVITPEKQVELFDFLRQTFNLSTVQTFEHRGRTKKILGGGLEALRYVIKFDGNSLITSTATEDEINAIKQLGNGNTHLDVWTQHVTSPRFIGLYAFYSDETLRGISYKNKAELVDVITKIANGLTHMHESGFLHNDIKPDNVLIRREQSGLELKITDFSSCVGTDYDSSRTQGLLGSRSTVDPLAVFATDKRPKKEKLDFQSDIYSFAKTILISLTNSFGTEFSLRGETSTATYGKRSLLVGGKLSEREYNRGLEDHLSKISSQYTRAVKTVLRKALSLDPKERYSTIEEFKTALVDAVKQKTLKQRLLEHKGLLATGIALCIPALGLGYNNYQTNRCERSYEAVINSVQDGLFETADSKLELQGLEHPICLTEDDLHQLNFGEPGFRAREERMRPLMKDLFYATCNFSDINSKNKFETLAETLKPVFRDLAKRHISFQEAGALADYVSRGEITVSPSMKIGGMPIDEALQYLRTFDDLASHYSCSSGKVYMDAFIRGGIAHDVLLAARNPFTPYIEKYYEPLARKAFFKLSR